jgi:sugar O-acyltransferase (sialic acid O-acetyltransferase NeuD family)
MKDNLIIIGAGGHGKVCADIAIRMNRWKDISFLDDNEELKELLGLKIIGKTKDFVQYLNESDFFVGIGNNLLRESVQSDLKRNSANIATLIHPGAVIGGMVNIKEGTVVMAGGVINCSTTIGKGCIINTCTSVDHDSTIEDYVHISPGVNICGSVSIGRISWLGVGASVINNVSICSGTIIGAGSVVITNIDNPGTYVGIPATLQKK